MRASISSRPLRSKAMPHNRFTDGARHQKLQQVVAPARLRTSPRHAATAERLTANERAGSAAIDIQISDPKLAANAFDVTRRPRVKAAGQGIFAIGGQFQRFV